MISVIVSIMDRTHLLKHSMEAVLENRRATPCNDILEVNVCDSGSTDGLEDYLEELSNKEYIGRVNKWYLDETKSPYKKRFNCPALIYNCMVNASSGEYILKIDPEFTFITDTFMDKALFILRDENRPAIVMPLPHHVYDFEFSSVQDIRDKYKGYEYATHITRETAPRCNVYYGCIFRRVDYINLGGIDVRFLNSVGSEDDHMMDRWRAVYGENNVVTLLEEEGVHLWHGEWGKGVPAHLYTWVDVGVNLRNSLKHINPNDGKFNSIKWPELVLDSWRQGKQIISKRVVQD